MTDLFSYQPKQNAWDIPGLFDDFKTLQEAGHSHTEVARRLNAKYPDANLSKNACIGKLNRSRIVRPSARMHHVEWDTPGLVDALKAHHAAGVTFPLMARKLSTQFQITITSKAARTKARRLGLPIRAGSAEGVRKRRAKERRPGWMLPSFATRLSPQDEAGRLEYKRKLATGEIKGRGALAVASTDDDYTPAEMRKSLLDMGKNECRWPYGDGPYTFCARPTSDTYPSYCVAHAMVHFLGRKEAQNFQCEAAE